MSRPAGGSRRWRSGTQVPRRQLTERLREALRAGSVLVVAGAGSGKTTALELALDGGPAATAWISCGRRDRDPGVLLVRIVAAISDAAPGASEVLAERLAAARERVDPLGAARELLDELARLLVEPLVLVLDDAERLDGAVGSLALLGELIRAESAALRLAVASRAALDLRVAKPRAGGRLAELGAADLAFDAEECATLLRAREEIDPSPAAVAAVMEATEGWPLGIALVAAEAGAPMPVAVGPGPSLASAPDLRAYLAEELLELLEPDLRTAIVDSSVVRVVSPAVARALDLPTDFSERIERTGALVRHLDGSEAFAYHPLLREFLAERFVEERDEAERERLHAAVAAAVASDGDTIGAIEHLLAARDWAGAVGSLVREGPALVGTSQDLVRGWLERLPPDERRRPAIRALEGRLEWLAGDSHKAAPALRDAVDGFDCEPPDTADEWLVRTMLVDALWGEGDIDAVEEAIDGWDDGDATASGLGPAAAMLAAAVLVTSGRFEDGVRLAAAARGRGEEGLLASSEAVFQVGVDVPAGRFDATCKALRRSAAELERADPLQHQHHVLAALAVVLAERGYPEEAQRTWTLIAGSARGGGAPRLADAAQGWRALLFAQGGHLEEAERELATYEAVESGSRGFVAALAPATVAALRGDADGTTAWAEEGLAIVAEGAALFRYWVAADLIVPLAEVGHRARAHAVLAESLSLVDSHYPGDRGPFFRARLLALRAWLRAGEGDAVAAQADLIAAWGEAGEALPDLLRREWRRLEPLVSAALEEGALEPRAAIASIARAFPGGLELVPFLEHPVGVVRGAALEPAVASGAPPAIESLRRLRDDPDQEVAGAAARAAERLASSPPPLHLAVLGGLSLRSGAWRTGEDDWGRPVDARLVRLLIVHEGHPVPEEAIVETLWPQLSPSGGRRSLQVAISRARRVLDPPGAPHSRIEGRERTYRLRLGERDTLDADEFAAAAAAALAERGEDRARLLERARSRWSGEPLPEERYADWATAFRERLLDRYTAVLTALVEVREGAGDVAAVAEVARELVALDPLNEGAHRALIVAYSRGGRRGHALRQYLECRRALVEDLGIEPSEETTRLQARILAGRQI